jgi:pyruvate dehydrogenase E2 component (dihydrolipoamide acetyltransferase)
MEILMPQLGETVAEGTITVWYKSVGDAVCAGDNLFEIETDKTSMEVPATAAGVLLEIRVAAGATVPVGSVVAVLSGAGAQSDRTRVPDSVTASAASTAALDPFQSVRTPERNFGPATISGGVKVTPVARRMAAELGVNLGGLSGSGPHGRIVAIDVRTASERSVSTLRATTAASSAVTPTAGQVKSLYAGVPYKEIALDAMRRTIARRLLESKQTVPHFYLSVDVAMDRLANLRNEVNSQAIGAVRWSVNDFIIRAMALALQRVPQANAVWADDHILQLQHSDVGVAIAVEGGLFTPIVRKAELKSMSAISDEIKSLADRARNRSLKPADYQGGSITVSNLGMYGVDSFSAIINPPQSAILAVGAARSQPVEGPSGSVRFSSIMSVTISCDHRVIDGALGAQLLAAFKTLMEAPTLLFL